jgi:prepilin-type N-terminal cleavage/methylation domain-containing protein/prepilin-type processing-associated H-X9-DG protein
MSLFPHTSEARHPHRTGFTLIEILVVIAIIALLAAILFPVFSRAREGARTKVCLSNLKQLGLGFQQYLNDSGNRYPGAGEYQKWGGLGQAVGTKLPDGVSSGHWVKGINDDNTAHSGPGKLAYLDDFTPSGNKADVAGGGLYPYVKSTQVFICPSNPDGEAKGLTYSMNCAIAGMHSVRMTQPTEVIVLVDEDKANDGFWYAINSTSSTDALTQIHNHGGNLLFADGHAKFYPYDVYPLDRNAGALKTRMTEAPRFYDKSFGTAGYWNPSPAPLGTCAAP